MSADPTLDYYNVNARAFAASTVGVDFTAVQERFLSLVPAGGRILDFGCGPGRDTRYFLERGFEVDAWDGSAEMCRLASEYAGIEAEQRLFCELDAREAYDGVWACSSILHLPKAELPDVLARVANALKSRGVFYASFKLGDFEGMRNGRYFSDVTVESFETILARVPSLRLEEHWLTGDVRPGREGERWLNLLMRRD